MDWKEKIKQGMILITEGCQQQREWTECQNCPFRNYCDTIEEAGYNTPDEWMGLRL